MRDCDYTEDGNKVWEIDENTEVSQRPDGRFVKATATDESEIESAEARELIAAGE